MPSRIAVADNALMRLRRLAADAYPEEGCGVLVGSAEGATVRVVDVTAGTNLCRDRAHDRYELDPGDIVRAERAARETGLDVVGFWHSHPDGVAVPSGFDRERAWPEWVYAIAAVSADGAGAIRAWVVDGDATTEIAVEASAA